jgi:hypothetical protein
MLEAGIISTWLGIGVLRNLGEGERSRGVLRYHKRL